MGVLTEDLNKFHLSVKQHLALGKFVTPEPNPETVPTNTDITPETPFGHPKFRNPSKWNPPGPMIFEHMSLLNQEHIVESHEPKKNLKFNLTKEERSANRSLAQNKDIVIKKADKGSAVVVQNRSDYIKEGLRQLTDRNFYRIQEENLTHIHNELISEQVQRMLTSKEISPKNAEYLILETPRTPNFYLLPKIHKNTIPPPGRPIVSANGCPSERISQFVDHFIQPLVHKLPSYLRDSTHLINLLTGLRLPDDAILASLDVTSLYTNIPNTEGINAAASYLFNYRPPHENPTNASLCKLLELVLTTNNFRFDNKEYLQIGGTAMGTKLAPSFANLFMGHLEEKFVYSYPRQPFIWKRFIDDIFFVWTYGQPELDKFVTYLNNCHDTIKFTLETSCLKINFLDITITKENDGTVSTNLYCKPTDSHNYLLYSSEHPRHLLNGIPYSQFVRIKRLCSKPEDFRLNALMLITHFIRRGYPKHLVLGALEKADNLKRDDLLNKENFKKQSDPKSVQKFYCVTTHNPLNPPLRHIITSNWDILGKTKTTRPLLDSEIVFGLRRNKNLLDHLVRASTSTKKVDAVEKLVDARPCKRLSSCRYCPRLNRSGNFVCHTNKLTLHSKINVNCQTMNCIYLITCSNCGIQYVGQTKNKLLTRFNSHHFDISHNNDTTVARHFNKCPRLQPAKFEGVHISVLSFIRAPPDTKAGQAERDKEEKRWIHRLSSVVPRGLNLSD